MGEAELTESPNLEYKDPTAKVQDDTQGITIPYHGQTTNRDRRTGYTADNARIQKPHKIDTWPNPCHRWHSGSFLCISSSSPCVRTFHWLGLCYSPALRISYKK
jgi:hypothetical protein